MILDVPKMAQPSYFYVPSDVNEGWRIGCLVATPIAGVVSLFGVVISILRLISEINQGEALTAIDYIVLAVSVVMFLAQAFAEVVEFLVANGKDRKVAAEWEMSIALIYTINILINVALVIATTYPLLSPTTPDFEELLRELLTLFIGYVTLSLLTLASSLVVFINYLHAGPADYQTLPSRPQAFVPFPRLQNSPPAMLY